MRSISHGRYAIAISFPGALSLTINPSAERVEFACLFWRANVSALAHKNKLYWLRAHSLAFLAQFGNGIVIALRPSSGVEPLRHSPEKAELLVREGRKATDHRELMPRDRRAAESEI